MTAQPRNKIRYKDILEVIKFTFTIYNFKTLIYKYGYYIHDHVAPLQKAKKLENVRIHPSSSLRCGENITIGKNSHINKDCVVWASKNSKIDIGNDVLMGPGVKMFSSNHSIKLTGMPMNTQPSIEKDIKIGDDVWIGSNSTILAGVNIEEGAVVAAGSVVSKNVERFTIVGGNPAKTIKVRNK